MPVVLTVFSFLQNICYHERKLSVEPHSVSIACSASLQQPIGKMFFFLLRNKLMIKMFPSNHLTQSPMQLLCQAASQPASQPVSHLVSQSAIVSQLVSQSVSQPVS